MREELVETVAKNLLKQWNRDRRDTKNWPDGQDWDELSGTSQTTLYRHACELLEIDWKTYRKWYRNKKAASHNRPFTTPGTKI